MNNFLVNCVLLFVHVPRFRNWLLNRLGMHIDPTARIGACIAFGASLDLGADTIVRSFNVIRGANLSLRKGCTVGRFNRLWGDFDVDLQEATHIGNFCIFQRGINSSASPRSVFSMGKGSNVTSRHYFDLSGSIVIGSNAVIGGRDCQLWTHGFVHFKKGTIRAKKIGTIKIGDGVYIGASSIVSPGSIIHDDVNIGAGCIVAGELKEPGLYVNAKLRYIPTGDFEEFERTRRIVHDVDSPNPLIVE
jgi:serine acetyltransferase